MKKFAIFPSSPSSSVSSQQPAQEQQPQEVEQASETSGSSSSSPRVQHGQNPSDENLAAMQSARIMQRARYHALGVMAKHIADEACNYGLMQGLREDLAASTPANSASLGAQTPHSVAPLTATGSQTPFAVGRKFNVVALRAAKHQYATWPTMQQPDSMAFLSSLSSLNVGASMTVRNAVTEGLLDLLSQDSSEVVLSVAHRIQVVNSPSDIAQARKAQGLAFVRSIKAVVVWSDEASKLLDEALVTHNRLLKFFWQIADEGTQQEEEVSPEEAFNRALVKSQFKIARSSPGTAYITSSVSSMPFESHPEPGYFAGHANHSMTPPGSVGPASLFNGEGSLNEQAAITPSTSGQSSTWGNSSGQLVLHSASRRQGQWNSDQRGEEELTEKDLEAETEKDRPVIFVAPVIHGLSTTLAVLLSCLTIRQALYLSLLDGHWTRMAICVITPIIFGLVMFLSDTIIGIVVMIIGPVRQLHINSRYYSGERPRQLQPQNGKKLPHITIQMPVYKESLVGVLRPSFESIKKAIRTYELQGGSASILVSEDGMTAIDEEERLARLSYYEENNITWIARPKHGDNGFIREGRFKKASNLNFTYEVMARVNAEMQVSHPELFASVLREGQPQQDDPFTTPQEQAQFNAVYNQTLQQVLQSIHPKACGAGHTAMGQFILLIDSDTRIPEDCFLDAASELTQSKDVGILQHCSGVMYVSTSFFERAIGFFTSMVNFAISYAVANGDVSPFMGHNAYLRWSAMQEIARTTYDDKGALQSYKIWSDEHVSEDFVMALDMLDKGYIVRWATYANGLYEEGVSLTCTDELNRWQKYAWGVSEMIFNKFHHWWRRGPITKLIWRFLWGNAPIHYKYTSMSYCLSYYAIAVAVPGCIALTLIKAWLGFGGMSISTTFQVMVATLVVFLAASTLSYSLIQFRAGHGSFLSLLWQRVKYLPFMVFFFGGLPYHILLALCAHLLNINMTWGATIKDWTASNVFAEIPELMRRFWVLFLFWIVVLGGVSVCTTSVVPLAWQLSDFFDLFPLYLLGCLHILYPFVLNPNLLRFSF